MKAFFCLVFIVMGAFALPVAALDVQVEVSETGKDATDARIKAMTTAEQLAFAKILEDKAPKKKDELLKSYDEAAISQMVQGYEIVEESMTPNSYTATMKVKFSDTAINQLFGAAKPKAKGHLKANGAVLIVPVYFGKENQVLLWETGNRWREAVNKAALQAKAGRWIAPLGDPTDLLVADSNSVLSLDFGRLEPLAERYGAGEILMAIAKPAENILAVEMRHLSAKEEEKDSFVVEAPQNTVMAEADLLRQAAEKMLLGSSASSPSDISSMEAPLALTDSQQKSAPPKPQLHQLNVLFYLKQARDWAEINHRLITIPGVEGVQPLSADWHHMNAVITYRGFPEELGKSLGAAGIDVRQDGDVLMMKIR